MKVFSSAAIHHPTQLTQTGKLRQPLYSTDNSQGEAGCLFASFFPWFVLWAYVLGRVPGSDAALRRITILISSGDVFMHRPGGLFRQ